VTAKEDATIIDVPRADTSETDLTAAGGPTILAARYELLGLLGSGGMGTVYRARDRELDEVVALKVLKQELAATPGMLERFRREVKLARRVTHRNVARTFDIGEDGADRFLTMEFIEGESLSSRAARAGRMSEARVVGLAREILEALTASHEAGVVHGDLKPENVIIGTNERVVITDFGISRALAADPDESRTAAGAIVGTPAYMAPEQVEGVRDLDGRADLYALGCMMFRLLTGQAPWGGDTFVAVAAARLVRDPPDPRALVADLSEHVAAFVLRCMARDRGERFGSAREAIAGLGSVVPGAKTTGVIKRQTGAVPTKSVAVLPITNGGAPDDAYLASGLTDDLIDVLSAVPGLRVRPRGAAVRHAQHDRDAQRAGRALDVDVVVEGSLRRSGDTLRTTLRVVTVNDGFQLWARRFEREAAAFLSIADEAAVEIAEVLASEKVAENRQAPTDAAALDLYLRGRFIFVNSYFDVAQAVALLRAAHERSPRDGRIAGTYALALMRHYFLESLPETVCDVARVTAEAALGRDPSLSEARVALALVHSSSQNPAGMALELRRALAAAPDSPEALLWMGNLLAEVGRTKQAIVSYRRAQAADPSFGMIAPNLARAYALLGDWETAEDTAAPSLAHGGDILMQWLTRARLALWKGNREQAAKILGMLEHEPLPDVVKHRIVRMLIVARDQRVSADILETIEHELRPVRLGRRAAFNAQIRAELFARGGMIAEATESLDQLAGLDFLDLSWLERCPAIELLRATKPYEQLLARTRQRAAEVHAVLDRTDLALTG
jgi:serine/threonine-protein kinase